MKAGVKITGIREVQDDLKRIGRIAGREHLLPALYAGGAVVRDEMRRIVRKKSGDTADSIAVRPLKGPGNNEYFAAVRVGPVGAENNHVARLLQDGHLRKNLRTGNVSHIPGYPFVDPAADAKGDEAAAVIEAALLRDAGQAA